MDQSLKRQVELNVFPILDRYGVSHSWDGEAVVLCYASFPSVDAEPRSSFTEPVEVESIYSFSTAFRILLEDMLSFNNVSQEDVLMMGCLRALIRDLPSKPLVNKASE